MLEMEVHLVQHAYFSEAQSIILNSIIRSKVQASDYLFCFSPQSLILWHHLVCCFFILQRYKYLK